MRTLDLAAELKAADSGAGTFTGFASTFGNKDLTGDIIAPGAFDKSLKSRPASKVKLLHQHRADQVLGVFDEITETDHGLRVKGRLAIETQLGRDTFALMKMGALDGLSIGFRADPSKQSFDKVRNARVLKEIDLLEVSVVTFPANESARVSGVRALPSKVEFERVMREQFNLSQREAKCLVAAGYDALLERRNPTAALLESLRRAAAALRD